MKAPPGSAVRFNGTNPQWFDKKFTLLAPDGSISMLTATGVEAHPSVPLATPYVALGRANPPEVSALDQNGMFNWNGQAGGGNGISSPLASWEDYTAPEALLADGNTEHMKDGPYLRFWGGFHTTTYERPDHTLKFHAGNYAGTDGDTGIPSAGENIRSASGVGSWGGYNVTFYVKTDGTTGIYGTPSKTTLVPLPPGDGWLAVSAGWCGNTTATFLRVDGHTVNSSEDGLEAWPVQTPAFVMSPQGMVATATVTFPELLGDTVSVLPWELVWGDGERTVVPVGTATGATFDHTYAAAGTQTVKLVVPDTDLAVDTETVTVS
jgi:hypothetical protein